MINVNETLNTSINDRLTNRLKSINLVELMDIYDVKEVYLGGNSLNVDKPNDYDLYLKESDSLRLYNSSNMILIETKLLEAGYEILTKSKNAITLSKNNICYQICKYSKASLKELIDSFDFSYCQVGARIYNYAGELSIKEIYYTDHYIEYLLTKNTKFINSEYPLSSLIRCFKINDKGYFLGKSYIPAVINILTNIINRGFDNYADFKDQLDAVDLGLLEEDYKDAKEDFLKLFEMLNKNKD